MGDVEVGEIVRAGQPVKVDAGVEAAVGAVAVDDRVAVCLVADRHLFRSENRRTGVIDRLGQIVAADGAACCGKGRHKVGVLPHQPKKLSAVLLRHIRHGELHRYHDHQHGGTDQQLQHAARAAVRGLLPLSLCFAAHSSISISPLKKAWVYVYHSRTLA